ncbi:hypothetical protein [Aliarcobacter butzleri]|uniref:Uncharacterized protein n=1 Tax=Aliarcobacter butzleri L352 TaxID=1447260 RepID=A0A837JCP5_9BACT|nr:hypothetical protein [Aliarcobacter butzleri]KLE05302.1 hypothetical protein AF77_05085 [Aliarcobacter butzleri L352]
MQMIMDFISIYGIPIVIILSLIAFHNKYKKDREFLNIQNNGMEEKNTLKKYLKEVFIERARKRPFLSAIPQIGIIFSLAFILFFLYGIFIYIINPFLEFDELRENRGKVIGYKYNKKTRDKLIVKLHNEEIRDFYMLLPKKEEIEKWINKEIVIWTQPKESLFGEVAWHYVYGVENYHYIDFFDDKREKQFYNLDNVKEHYELHIKEYLEFSRNDKYRLYTAIKFLLFFIFCLWLVNRKPIKNSTKGMDNGKN